MVQTLGLQGYDLVGRQWLHGQAELGGVPVGLVHMQVSHEGVDYVLVVDSQGGVGYGVDLSLDLVQDVLVEDDVEAGLVGIVYLEVGVSGGAGDGLVEQGLDGGTLEREGGLRTDQVGSHGQSH